ncbi:hypothetical protein ACJDU8_00955 [Clostridium sp. WILCCON 0269]|uniref:Uncharacterized protein n=1 Tax=Candidatus Clostridium eludens TaxID=3381663 RepID=A0ABW8SF43_9CLOT
MSYVADKDVEEVLEYILSNKDITNIDEIPNISGTRIKYSYIFNFIQKLDDEQRDQLNTTTNDLINRLNKDEDKDILLKLLDYLALEIPRATTYNGFREQIARSQIAERNLRKQIREKTSLLDKYEIKIEKLQTDFIGILSIFSTVVLAFFGGLSILGSSLDNISKVSKYRISFIVLIIVFSIFNIIFMLLNIISKLTDKDISVKCNKENICESCSEKISLRCLIKKYPLVYWYNLICIVLMTCDFIAFIIDKYNVITYIFNLNYKESYSKVGIISLIIMIIITFLILIYKFISNKIKIYKRKNKLTYDLKNKEIEIKSDSENVIINIKASDKTTGN